MSKYLKKTTQATNSAVNGPIDEMIKSYNKNALKPSSSYSSGYKSSFARKFPTNIEKLTIDADMVNLSKSAKINTEEIIKHRLECFDRFKKAHDEEIANKGTHEISANVYDGSQRLYKIKAVGGKFTPYEGAKHISEDFKNSAICAQVNNFTWDLHRPIDDPQNQVTFCDLKEINVENAYKVYWKSIQFLVPHIVELALPKDSAIYHISSPWPHKSLGYASFASDLYIDAPSRKDFHSDSNFLYNLNEAFEKFVSSKSETARTMVNESQLMDLFKYNKLKKQQLASLFKNQELLPIYNMGSQVDMSFGPLLPRLSVIGRTKFTAIHKISAYKAPSNVYRVQGVSVPEIDNLNHEAFELLCQNAEASNRSPHITLTGKECFLSGTPVWKTKRQYTPKYGNAGSSSKFKNSYVKKEEKSGADRTEKEGNFKDTSIDDLLNFD